jgi:hypothetical protein
MWDNAVPTAKNWLQRCVSGITRFRAFLGNLSLRYPKSAIALIVAAALLPVLVNWRRWWHWVPETLSRVGNAGIAFAQVHPRLGATLQFLLDAVPDAVPLLLALAGLGYYMPDLIKKIEGSKRARISIMCVFVAFALTVVVVNAINRTAQDQDKQKLNEKIGVVQDQNNSILTTLTRPNETGKISEIDRKQNIEKVLRNEYILSHNPIDQEILAGTKMPPDVWMNERLKQLGERWTVTNVQRSTPSQIAQQSAPEEKARVEFSFYQDDMTRPPITMKLDPIDGGKVTFSISAIARGEQPAENLSLWIRRCEPCEWESPNPPSFAPPDPDRPSDRGIVFPILLPNVSTPRWEFTVKIPRFPKYNSLAIGCYYACKNCPPVDWKRPQTLWIVSTMQSAPKLQFPPISFEPADKKK